MDGTVPLARPHWTEKMYPQTGGLDHLGVGSVSSDRILPSLSPGINVLTVHPRYHSFYVFLLDEFWRRDRPRHRTAWVQFFRPREFIFSLGTHFCDRPQHGDLPPAVGSLKIDPLANRQLDAYDTTTYYIKNDLGGYGLYYRSVMAEAGLIYPGGPGFPYPVDVPSEYGKEVAAAFRRSIDDTSYYREFFDLDSCLVPISIIRQYIRQACLCQLQLPAAPDRPFLLDVFLHHGLNADARRATFRLLLDIASQSQGYSLADDVFRQVLCFGAADSGLSYTPREDVASVYRLWRLFQAREYYAFALNAMFYHLCDWGLQRGDVRPIPLEQIWKHLDDALSFERLATLLNAPRPGLGADSSFASLLRWLQRLCNVSTGNFDTACDLTVPVQEHILHRLAINHRTDSTVMVAGMLTILSLIFLRFAAEDRWNVQEVLILRMGGDERLSVDGFIRGTHHQLAREASLGEVVRWLFNDYIILQHQLVAISKMPANNTFRFQRDGDRLRFFNLENAIGFIDPRYTALRTTLYELGLCADLRQADHPLTQDGKQLLTYGDLNEEPPDT
ncbi:MAG: hypothetical protein JOZ41_06385 [Chloroflexi bacterium]|nr:hypothetical protein [Chloroflexota bacterium]